MKIDRSKKPSLDESNISRMVGEVGAGGGRAERVRKILEEQDRYKSQRQSRDQQQQHYDYEDGERQPRRGVGDYSSRDRAGGDRQQFRRQPREPRSPREGVY